MNNVHFNSISGTLVKSYLKSKIIRFQKQSTRAGFIFAERPTFDGGAYASEICVLQVMLCPEDYFLVEYIDKDELEKNDG